jgi:hypothetical protein
VAIASKEGIDNNGDGGSPAIYLAYKLFVNCLQKQESLEVIESLMLLLQGIPIEHCSATDQITIVFGGEVKQSDSSTWLNEQVLGNKEPDVRKFLYLSLYLLLQWLETGVDVLSKIAGADLVTEQVQT